MLWKCQQIWKTHQDWKRSVFIPVPKKGNAKEYSDYCTIAPISHVKSLSHIWLCDPMDYSLPGSSVHGIFQARVLEWVAISFSRGSSQPRVWTWVSHTTGRRSTIWATREASKVMFKILQTRLQWYVNCELPDIQAGFRKGRGTRDQIANIRRIIEKVRAPETHLLLLYWLCQRLWLCGSQ